MVGDKNVVELLNALERFSWSTVGLLIVPVIVFILSIIGLITIIKWIF